ncbi:flagellar basal-body MS-ring/collar protein FliF [Gilvimarinus sp. 1_MG-2023]|uniref:flagellar basal-body MS-ring/collar protein FliF n=1 Tax=Gilvimarinus sp. 1_MG-2023 TaxID=3062638 RepID=UPI0026E143F9|nr:flagellar basal-body MS-ring/collar protein FliF [Gilvimarinus sp. 1_MG-2023]MDO6745966.1 flagellar basal-body MS-ring/collar protein FliF [Gilvimarinus sp. 1_MG-2023]
MSDLADPSADKSARGNDLVEGFSSLTLLRQVGLMVGLAASVAIGFYVVLWSQGEEYRPLYGSLDRLDSAQVVDILEQNQIHYKIEPSTGALLVTSDEVHSARLKLAEVGIGNTQSVGFELLEQEQALGTSQFIESARYHRSLEGELARTVTSIHTVRSARVHLAIPKRSVFVRDARKPSASVFLEVFPGRDVAPRQVKAIANLVASSISELSYEDVTVIDQHGSLLSAGDESPELELAGKQRQYTEQLEESLLKRVNSILEPVLGGGNFRAEINADVDFTAVEQAQEVYDDEQPVVRSEHLQNERRTGDETLGGIPGALTNQPPIDGQAPEQIDPATGLPLAEPPVQHSREDVTRNYEVDRTISYTRRQQGNIERLSVAVVLDDKLTVDAEGQNVRTAWEAQEIDRLVTLVQNAVGFSEARGDSVTVINSSFAARNDGQMEAVEVPWWQQAWLQPYVKPLAGFLLILALIFGLLRPILKSIANTGAETAEDEEARQLQALEDAGLGGDMSSDSVTLTGGAVALPGPEEGYEQQLNAIKGLIAEDPGRVAQVVKSWINKDE